MPYCSPSARSKYSGRSPTNWLRSNIETAAADNLKPRTLETFESARNKSTEQEGRVIGCAGNRVAPE